VLGRNGVPEKFQGDELPTSSQTEALKFILSPGRTRETPSSPSICSAIQHAAATRPSPPTSATLRSNYRESEQNITAETHPSIAGRRLRSRLPRTQSVPTNNCSAVFAATTAVRDAQITHPRNLSGAPTGTTSCVMRWPPRHRYLVRAGQIRDPNHSQTEMHCSLFTKRNNYIHAAAATNRREVDQEPDQTLDGISASRHYSIEKHRQPRPATGD